MTKAKVKPSGQTNQHGTLTLKSLVPSRYNMRKQPRSEESIREMAALIAAANGIIQNLVVHPIKEGRKQTGTFGVAAGETRRLALELLAAEDGAAWAAYEVPVMFISESDALAMSTQENTRTAIHPADEFEAFHRMVVDENRSIEEVASSFGVTPDVVRRRLKLAQVAPAFIDMLRNNEISLELLMALTAVDGHKAQIDLWNSLPAYNRNAHSIRSIARGDGISGSSRFASFVGLEAYQLAGGAVECDLFDGAVTFRDAALLRQLVMDSLAAEAATIDGDDGVNWVEVVVDEAPYEVSSLFPCAPTVSRTATADEQGQMEQLRQRLDEIHALLYADESDEQLDEDEASALYTEQDEKDSALDALLSSLQVPHPDSSELTGAVVFVGNDGVLRVTRDVLRKVDAERFKTQTGIGASGDSADKKAKPIHSERLCRDLSAHRSIAIAGHLANQPLVALATVTSILAGQLFSRYEPFRHIRVSMTNHISSHLSDGRDEAPASKLYSESFEQWHARISSIEGPLLNWMLEQDQDSLLSLLALCVAASFDGIQGTDSAVPESIPTLLSALGIDMSDWWKPTADGYFSSVPKHRTVAVLCEAGVVGESEATALALLKKGELTHQAETLLVGTRWVPELMRVA
ncbi:ParB/Srx family N-terminal domain-containing protein [Zoogloeaceae bacterium G21618-S1]|nr:ParB/Srx family N-terminal domain-containing protein [Zoogloeaceae bacterium G21618-S1]